MDNFYIYSFNYEKNKVKKSATVIFCDRTEIDEKLLQKDIEEFYQRNSQTDEMYILAGDYISQTRLNEIFIQKASKTFKGIPELNISFLLNNTYLITFNHLRVLNSFGINKGIPKEFEERFIIEGLQNIFKKREGLVVSEGAHHFVFPSGKHCDRFLRVGNILLNSSEIYFIAFTLLNMFKEKKHKQIYCDTSSINTIAFALVDLKNRLTNTFEQIPIKSFGSYEGLFKNDITYKKSDLLLISASTSGSIINYISKKQQNIDSSNIIILFFLGKHDDYINIKERVICNLTLSDKNPNGIPFYPTYKEKCQLCEQGSYPVEIKGDVFSLEKPKINKIVLSINDPQKNLSDFVEQFKSIKKNDTILKANYKDSYNNIYDVFIEYNTILDNIDNYKEYRDKLNSFIDQYVPSNTKYIIASDDNASNKLSEYIVSKIEYNYLKTKIPKIRQINKLPKGKQEGTVLVVASCISNGKNLLYISRALRKYDKLKIVYFVGITRSKNKKQLDFLKSNLKQGFYGSESNSFIEVESLYCADHSKESPWSKEASFINNFIVFVNRFPHYSKTKNYLNNRKNILETEIQNNKGLSENLFYPWFRTSKEQELVLRKNFVFFKFDDYVKHVTQSDVYFTISNIINSLRNSDKQTQNLKQETFLRSIIDPSNYNRYNDGIIQASILRAANSDELAYSLNYDLSNEMANTLETMIKFYSEEQGEALAEFLYAIAIKKLSLKKEHLERVIQTIDSYPNISEIIQCFSKYIKLSDLSNRQIDCIVYLESNTSISSDKYMKINSCSRAEANKDLDILLKSKFIKNKSNTSYCLLT